MEYRHLGRTGLKVSVLSFGAWVNSFSLSPTIFSNSTYFQVTFGEQVDLEEAYNCMKIAYDHGCNFFDNAEVYAAGKAEVVMGQVLKRMFEKDGIQRSDLVISTKLFWGTPYYHPQVNKANLKGLSRKHIIEGIKGSLKRLDLDYVDVVFAHRPDSHTPMDEVVRAFNWVLDKGYAFYWGTSEWSAEEIRYACEVAEKLNLIGPCAEQPQCKEPFCRSSLDRSCSTSRQYVASHSIRSGIRASLSSTHRLRHHYLVTVGIRSSDRKV